MSENTGGFDGKADNPLGEYALKALKLRDWKKNTETNEKRTINYTWTTNVSWEMTNRDLINP